MAAIQTFALGPLETNCYLYTDGGCGFVIDPGGDPQPVLQQLERDGAELEAIINTHLHFDHIHGNAALHKATGAPIYAPQADESLLQTEVGAGGFMGLPEVPGFSFTPVPVGQWQLCGVQCQVLPTPGHTQGSISVYFEQLQAVFVGDLVFARSVGRTDFPGGDASTLAASVREHIFSLPPETRIYPGHGPQTSVAEEQAHNPFFQEGGFL